MTLLTFCTDRADILEHSCQKQNVKFVNVSKFYNKGWEGFFKRWIYIQKYLEEYCDDEETIIISDGTDVVLSNIKQEDFDKQDVISCKFHEKLFRNMFSIGCCINAGVFVGKKNLLLTLCNIFTQNLDKEELFEGCDQSFLSYYVKQNDMQSLFYDHPNIYMNTLVPPYYSPKKHVIYHYIGCTDWANVMTEENLKRLGYSFNKAIDLDRYANYVNKWFEIEKKKILNKRI